MMRPIGLADLLIAMTVLKPETDEAKAGIARSLGYDYKPEPKPTIVNVGSEEAPLYAEVDTDAKITNIGTEEDPLYVEV